MRERGLIFALLAGMGAMTYHTAGPGAPPASPQPGTFQLRSHPTSSPEGELATTLSRFDKRRTFEIALQSDGTYQVTAPQLPSDQGQAIFDWAIAIVPDPERSHLQLDFDREIEALQLAAGSAGYQFERYWFPWRTERPSEKESSYVIRTESKEGIQDSQQVVDPKDDNHESLPGILLFRKGPNPPLALLLVSESPTGGVAPEEFRAAVSLGRALGSTGDHALRIIGPGLSGSLESLSILVHAYAPQQNLTSASIRTWTTDHASHNRFLKSFKQGDLPNGVIFRTLEVDSLPTVSRFVRFVREEWHDKTPIVLLTEETTAFGAASPCVDRDSKDAAIRVLTPAGADPDLDAGFDAEISNFSQKLDCDPKDPKCKKEYVFRVPFPRNLTQLRNATEKHDHLPGFGDDSRRSDIPHNGLLMSLKEESAATLEIPAFSREQTPVSQESILFSIGGLLKTGVVHYVGIVATDPLDTLFLTRYLRSASPNVRIFTISPDLLFEHGSDSSDYSGIIGLSSYPLFPLSQIWSGSRGTSYIFPSAASESVYNATLAALEDFLGGPICGKSSLIIDRACTTDSTTIDPKKADLRDRIDPFSHSAGALWITIAGHNGFEPIAIEDRNGPTPNQPRTGDLFPPEYWPGWAYTFGFVLSVCVAFCLLILFAHSQGHRVFVVFSARPDNYDRCLKHNPVQRAFYLFLIGMSLTALAAVWLEVPGVIVKQNLPNDPVEISGAFLFASGVIIVIACSRFSARLQRSEDLLPLAGHPAPTAQEPGWIAGAFLFFDFAVLLKPPPDGVPTYIIRHLWYFFMTGCFLIGSTFAASILPIWNAARVECEKYRAAKLRRFASSFYACGAVVIVLFVACIIAFVAHTVHLHQPQDFLASYRSLDLTNGVSPIVPLSLLFAALVVFSFVHLQRMAYYEGRRPRVRVMMGDKFCPKLNDVIGKVDTRIQRFQGHLLYWIAFVLFIAFLLITATGSSQTLEKQPLEFLIMFTVLVVGSSIALVWIRLVLLWSAFSEVLQQLERHPLRQVFSLFPRGFMWSPVWQGSGKKRTHVTITRSLECLYALKNHPQAPNDLKDIVNKELDDKNPESLTNKIKDLLAASADRIQFSRSKYDALERTLEGIAQSFVDFLRTEKWERGDYELKSELATKEETKRALRTHRPEFKQEEPATICSEFVAYRFLAFINFVLWHIDNLVMCLSAGFLLLVLALNSYAFRSRTLFDWLLVLFFAVLTTAVVIVFAQLARDAVLSRITGTEEGKLDRNFFTHLISYGAIPALVLLSTHFTVIGRFFFSWVKPALEAIH